LPTVHYCGWLGWSSPARVAAAYTTADAPTIVLPQHPIHGLLVHAMGRLATQHGPQMPIAERGVLLNQLPERLDPRRVHGHRTSTTCWGAMQPGPPDG